MKENGNEVIYELKNIIKNNSNFEQVDYLFGDITFKTEPKVEFYSKGSVYGIFIWLQENQTIEEFLAIFTDFMEHKLKIINDEDGVRNITAHLNKLQKIKVEKLKYFENGYYILYWGSEDTLGARINAHCKTYKKTSSLSLNYLDILKDYKLKYGSIPVTDYKKFEKYLHHNYKSILG